MNMELIEYHLLCIRLAAETTVTDFHSNAVLKILNPDNDYSNLDWCGERKNELEEKYFHDDGRLKE